MEKPILFSTPMIQAILAGRKSQTRRILKPQIIIDQNSGYKFYKNLMFDIHDDVLETMYLPDDCKYGQIGDILWVRETFIDLQKTPVVGAGSEKYKGLKYWYRADNTREMEVAGKYKPSIFMPKVACRIKLLIKNIQVERLQNITGLDAIAEGIGSGFQMNAGWPDYKHIKKGVCELTQDSAEMSYASLWESINGKDSWDKNPWVWKITFDKL